uniref:Dynein regulatory complex subunit 2 n=1 Tax=Drosophila willistoni TaxID=7260 RepID=B4MQB9_DROWI
MGKKGKGKGNKLAKMSEEERARYLQMRADMEEETRRRKMQLISMYMKNKLKREDAFGRLNMAKINQEWRSILRQVKIQDLRREIVDVESFFKEALKRKDSIIQRLMGHIESTEDMYANLQQSHMENVNQILAISKMQLQLEQITSRGEAKLEKLWQEYQTVLAGYCKHIEGFYSEYVDLKQRDEESAVQIRQQSYDIEHLINQLANLRLVSEDFYQKQQSQVEQRQLIKQQLTERLRELRSCVDMESGNDHQKFKMMSVESYDAIEKLKEHVAKGEILMQLSQVCNKMETQREKMFLLPELSREIIEIREMEPDKDLLKDEISIVPQMETFWRRVNHVAVDVACLKQQKKRLEVANSQLKAELQEYLVNLNISNGSNSHIHDYLSRRPKSMSVDRVSRLQLQPKMVKSALPMGRRAPSVLPPKTKPAFELTRSRNLLRSRPQLARIEM